jgi:hypothetical protein
MATAQKIRDLEQPESLGGRPTEPDSGKMARTYFGPARRLAGAAALP